MVQTYVGTYPPVYYGLVGWPSLLFGPRSAIFGMRIASALLCAALLASGLESARRIGRGRLVVVGFALGITPTVLDLFGSVNPNALEIAASCSLWPTLLVIVSTGSSEKRLLFRAAIAALLLATIRPLGPVWVAGIVVAILLAVGTPAAVAALARDRQVRIAAGVVAIAALGCIAFTLLNHTLSSVITVPGQVHDPLVERAGRALRGTALVGRDMVWLRTKDWSQALGAYPRLFSAWAALTVALAVMAIVVGRARQRLAVAAVLLACVALPVVSEVTNPGVSWQGRYGLPFAVGFRCWRVGRSKPSRGAARGVEPAALPWQPAPC